MSTKRAFLKAIDSPWFVGIVGVGIPCLLIAYCAELPANASTPEPVTASQTLKVAP